MSSWESRETPQSQLQISLKNVSLNKNQSRKGYNRILTPLNASITIPGRNFTDAFVTQKGDGMEEFRRVFYGSNEAMFNVWKKFYGRLETVLDFFLFKGFTAPTRRAVTPENWILAQTGRWDTFYVADMYTLLARREHTSEWQNRVYLVLTLHWHLQWCVCSTVKDKQALLRTLTVDYL